MELTQELLEQAKKAESAKALQALAKENDYEMSDEEAEAYFAQLHKNGELSDEELENVSGGGCRKDGHLVVNIGYCCIEHWKCKTHLRPAVRDKNGCLGCDRCTNTYHCRYCYYCHYVKGLWLCYNPDK